MSRPAGREDGFTLIELLVSLAILAVSLAVLFGSISGALDRERENSNAMIAGSLAQSLLARAGTEHALHEGASEGIYSNGFRWRLSARPYGSDDDAKAWRVSAYVVEATVSWQHDALIRSRTLTTLRIVPPEKAP